MLPKATLALIIGVLIVAFFFACSDNNNPTFPFEKTVLNVSIAKRCDSCFIMLWQHPIEKKDMESYYIWLDTTVVNDSTQNISQTHKNAATQVVPYSGRGDGDSLDLTNLIKSYSDRDSLHIAIWAKYAGSDQGAVYHFYAHFGDDMPPSTPSFNDSVSANTIWIDWVRPTDQKDFYKPDSINGPIAGYNVTIQARNTTENIRDIAIKIYLAGNDVTSSNLQMHRNFTKKGFGVALESATNQSSNFLGLAITDGEGFVSDNVSANNWKMEISGLRSQRTYRISVSAWDSSGNSSYAERYIATTDQIPPTIADEFWYYKDDSLARLDSNRLVLFWRRSIDVDGQVSGYQIEQCKSDLIEQCKTDADFEAIPRVDSLRYDYYEARYNLENESMVSNQYGNYVSDTLRWVLPGDSVILRLRAIDTTRHYSAALIEKIKISKGELRETECPPDFVPVKRDTLKTDSSVFCIEKLEHSLYGNVLYAEAKKTCEDTGFRLCTEQEWTAACNSGGGSYGVIEERNFKPAEFLSKYCGVGTGDSLSAHNFGKRNKICASPDGVRDLPGQLQEWVISASDSALIKGSSFAVFSGASIVELSRCANRFTPTRVRPRYTTDSVYLYKTGSRLDTLFTRDTLRTAYAVLPPDSLKNTILIYSLSRDGKAIGTDYVNLDEYNRRGGEEWLKVFWAGFDFKLDATLKAMVQGTETINASDVFLDPTVSFRCCSGPK